MCVTLLTIFRSFIKQAKSASFLFFSFLGVISTQEHIQVANEENLLVSHKPKVWFCTPVLKPKLKYKHTTQVLNSKLGCYIFLQKKQFANQKYANTLKEWQSSFTKYLKAPRLLRIYPSFKRRNLPHRQEERRCFHMWKIIASLYKTLMRLYTWEGLLPEGSSVCKLHVLTIQLTLRSVSHCGLAIYILTKKSILRQNKNYGNSNISPCKKLYLIFKTPSKRSSKPSKDIVTL